MRSLRQPLITLIALAIISLPFVLKPYVVAGISMEPTYGAGQKVLIDKLGWRIAGIQRGDVVVMRNPHDASVQEIKRIVGLPEEEITLGDNNVTVMYPDGTAETFGADTLIGRGRAGLFRMKLGPEDYLVLGDNRAQSEDSRVFGAVQKGDIIGRVILFL